MPHRGDHPRSALRPRRLPARAHRGHQGRAPRVVARVQRGSQRPERGGCGRRPARPRARRPRGQPAACLGVRPRGAHRRAPPRRVRCAVPRAHGDHARGGRAAMSAIIWVVGALAALSALGVVFSPQPLYSALSLVLTIGALAVLFLVLNAQFLFVVQLIVYAGAVMVLFVFIIALLSPGAEERFVVDTRFAIGVVVAIGITLAVVGATRNGVTLSGDSFRAQQVGSASDPYHAFSFDQGD